METKIDAKSSLKVVFTGEPGVDDGGPKREPFSGDLKTCGQEMGMSILQDGPTPNFMSPDVASYLVGEPLSPSQNKDPLLRTTSERLSKAMTDGHLRAGLTCDQVLHVLGKVGYSGIPQKETVTGTQLVIQLNNNQPLGVLRRRERFTLQILRDKMKSLSVLPLLFLTLVTIPPPSLQNPVPRESAGRPCVRQTHVRNGVQVTECESASFGCLRSIPTYGYPKCQPVYRMMEVPQSGENHTIASHLRGKQATIVDCVCAS